jgi:hypothetical protein
MMVVTRGRGWEWRREIGRLEVRGGHGVVMRGGSHPTGVSRTSASTGVGPVMVMVVRGGTEGRRATSTSRHGTNRGDGSVTRQPVLQQCNQLLLYTITARARTANAQTASYVNINRLLG